MSADLGQIHPRSAQPEQIWPAQLFFKKNPINYFPDLQTLLNHRIFSINANSMIQVAVSILAGYLSDGMGLMILGLM
jgi:nucleoside permease NupC